MLCMQRSAHAVYTQRPVLLGSVDHRRPATDVVRCDSLRASAVTPVKIYLTLS